MIINILPDCLNGISIHLLRETEFTSKRNELSWVIFRLYFVGSNPSRPKCAKRSFLIKSINVRETNLLTYAVESWTSNFINRWNHPFVFFFKFQPFYLRWTFLKQEKGIYRWVVADIPFVNIFLAVIAKKKLEIGNWKLYCNC